MPKDKGAAGAPFGLEFGSIAFDSMDAMVAYWDRDQVCRYANAAYLGWFGRSRSQMEGITLKDLLGHLYEMNLPFITKALSGERQVFERTIPLPDGRTKHSLATYTPHFENGEVAGFVAHVADVTRMKEFEQELVRKDREMAALNQRLTTSITLLQAIYEGAQVGLFTYDSSGQCTSCNAEASRLVGAPRETVLSQNWHRLKSWDERGLKEVAKEAIGEGKTISIETPFVTSFGNEFWGRFVFTPFVSGEEPSLLLMVEDFTKRKTAETERERVLEELSKALDNIKTLEGILPICAGCKKIRSDGNEWVQVEQYVSSHSKAEFSHGICPDCMKKYYPEFAAKDKR